jgi:hypothetical protein
LTSTDVNFTGFGGLTLHGTVLAPAKTSGAPRPGVVLVTGSGAGVLREHLLTEATQFARQGIAALMRESRLLEGFLLRRAATLGQSSSVDERSWSSHALNARWQMGRWLIHRANVERFPRSRHGSHRHANHRSRWARLAHKPAGCGSPRPSQQLSAPRTAADHALHPLEPNAYRALPAPPNWMSYLEGRRRTSTG